MNTGARIRRLWRHLGRDADDARRLLDEGALQQLTAQIRASEATHRGQIRLCIEAALPLGAVWHGLTPRARAVQRFGELGVWDTEDNVGVLVYLLLADRAIEIVADRGLTRRVPSAQWQALASELGRQIGQGQLAQGLQSLVARVDALLQEAVPRAGDTPAGPNELPDRPVLG